MLISSASQKLHLPPNVQVRRRGNTYIIYYGHDEVGGVVVTETPSGDTQLRPHVKDPVELNKDIVALVAQQMADALIGAPDSEDDSVARHLTLQLAPARGEVYRDHPDQMNSRLVELDDKHQC